MIYAFTSKKRGCGRSAITLMTSILVSENKNNSTILLDFSNSGDLFSLVSKDGSLSSVDGLIAGITLDLPDLGLADNIITIGNLNIVPGTRSRLSSFLYKRYLDVQVVLNYVSTRFNSVIIDIDEELLSLIERDLPGIKRVNILEQDILNVKKYQPEISTGNFNGFYVINNFREMVYPQLNFFSRNFGDDKIAVIPNDEDVATLLNRSGITSKEILDSSCGDGIGSLADMILSDASVVNSNYANKFRRVSILDFVLGRGSGLSKNKKQKGGQAVKKKKTKDKRRVRG